MQNKIPLVSVIIPMFNSAKFIPQTLESLLYQTMTDFEVVVVDDCSTDNSIEVVESFSERFNGRFHVIKMPKNTGTPGLPRNVGIQFARGKYIAFLDSDDLFTKTALEELSTLAEKFQADVVHMNDTLKVFGGQRRFIEDPAFTDMNALTDPANQTLSEWHWPYPRPKSLTELTTLPATLQERLKIWLDWQYRWVTCASFCKRDFLIAAQIFFPTFAMAEDMFFTFCTLCKAEKILCVPNIIYIFRPRAGSVSRENEREFDIKAFFHKRLSSIKIGFGAFNEFMDTIPFFDKNPKYRYSVSDFFFKHSINLGWQFDLLYANNPAFKFNELVKQEFHSDDAPLTAYLFNTVNVYRLQIMKLQQELAKLKTSK